MTIRSILVPVDFSSASVAALRFAAMTGERFGAEVRALFIWDRPMDVPRTVMVGHSDNRRPLIEVMRENVALECDDLRSKLPEELRSIAFDIGYGRPAEVIVERSSADADLIIMGTTGRGGIRGVLLGSVARSVLRHSTIPVLVVPHHA